MYKISEVENFLFHFFQMSFNFFLTNYKDSTPTTHYLSISEKIIAIDRLSAQFVFEQQTLVTKL